MHPIRYFRPWRMWRHHELKGSYDVVIVGGGAHGLAIAYELAKRGIRDVAVLDKSYMGAGGSGRNTTIVRANDASPSMNRAWSGTSQLASTLFTHPGMYIRSGPSPNTW